MLISLSEARRAIDRTRFRTLARTRVPVLQTAGKLAGRPIRAPHPLPRGRLSAMDGFALRLGRGLSNGPYRVRGESFPSSPPLSPPLRVGEASYITTGAPLPLGANAVVRIEATRRDGSLLHLLHPAKLGQDIMEPGEAMKRGDALLEQGEQVDAVHVGALIAQHNQAIPIFRLRTSILPIGDELRGAGSSSTRGSPDFMGPTIAALQPFSEVTVLPPAKDDRLQVARDLVQASRVSDLLITIGGSSAGAKDVTKAAISSVGKLLFEGVTTNVLKRGSVGFVSRTPVVVLPGQLVSAVAVYHEHGLHVLSRMVGRELRVFEEVVLAKDLCVNHRMDSTFLFEVSNGLATPLPWGVARMTALLRAGAFGVLSHGRQYQAGDRVRVQRLGVIR